MHALITLGGMYVCAYYSGVARPRNLVGHKYGKWSLMALNLTTPLVTLSELS